MFRSGALTLESRVPVLGRWARGLVSLMLLGGMLWMATPGWAAQTPPEKGTEKGQAGKKTAEKKKETAPPLEDSEIKLGRESAEENDKQVKLVTNATMVERVNRIGKEIAVAANSTPIPALWGSSQLKTFDYSFKIVDDKDVNAYSLPGGFIYVNKGLLDYVRSDDELAGVLAHEVAHAAHHHMVKLLKEQGKIDRFLLPLKLLALGLIISGKANNGEMAQNLLLGTNLFAIARVNSYGIEAEKDADNAGMLLMTHTKYNPVGLYSFMIRLAADEGRRGYADLGIFRTHPPGAERVEAAKKHLEELNIALNLSEVDPTLQLTVKVVKEGMTEFGEVRSRDLLLCKVIAVEGVTAEQRAQRIAKRLTGLIDGHLQPFEVRVAKDQTRITVRNFTLLTDADATAQNKPLATLAREFSDALMQVNQRRQFEAGI